MLRAKKQKKVILAQDAKFKCLLKNGTFADTLADSGLLNETAKNKEIEVVVSVEFNEATYTTGDTTAGYRPMNMLYTAKEDKKGKGECFILVPKTPIPSDVGDVWGRVDHVTAICQRLGAR